MSYPIKEILEIKSGVSKEDALTALKNDVEELSKTDPSTVYIKYYVITDTGDYVGMVSDSSKEIMGIEDNILIDKPLKNMLIEEIPSTFLKDYQFVIPTDSTMTDDEIQAAAQDKASELLKESTNTIPVIRIINLKNEENSVAVPAVFGDDFINTDEEQVSEIEGEVEDLTDEDVDTLMKRFQIQLKNQNLLSEDAEALTNQVQVAAKKTATVVKIAKDTEDQTYNTLIESGLSEDQAKIAAKEVSKKIKLTGDIENIDSIVDETITNYVPVSLMDTSTFSDMTTKLKDSAKTITKKFTVPTADSTGKVDIDQLKALNELKGIKTPKVSPTKLNDIVDKVLPTIEDSLKTDSLGFNLTQINEILDIVKNDLMNQEANDVITGDVYNYLIDNGFTADQIANFINNLSIDLSERDLISTSDVIYNLPDEAKTELARMVNDEKMARDLYNYAASKYPDEPIFAEIAKAEQKHMDKANELAQKYQVLDTDVVSLDPGEFSDDSIKSLYDSLVTEIDSSLTDALKVGVKVEVTDINDIEALLTQVQDINPQDIISVFNNLMNGSIAHYWSFDKALKDNGVVTGACSVGEDYCKTTDEYPMPFGVEPSIPEDVENTDSTGEVVDS